MGSCHCRDCETDLDTQLATAAGSQLVPTGIRDEASFAMQIALLMAPSASPECLDQVATSLPARLSCTANLDNVENNLHIYLLIDMLR